MSDNDHLTAQCFEEYDRQYNSPLRTVIWICKLEYCYCGGDMLVLFLLCALKDTQGETYNVSSRVYMLSESHGATRRRTAILEGINTISSSFWALFPSFGGTTCAYDFINGVLVFP